MPNRPVLVVDDSRIARAQLGRFLEQQGLNVDQAESGEDCLDYLRRNIPPSVIFLDHMMPGMDGFDVLRAIKANAQTAAIPVVMYTSKEGEGYMGEARALGASDILSKPIKPIELVHILQRLNVMVQAPAQVAAGGAPPPRPSARFEPVPLTTSTEPRTASPPPPPPPAPTTDPAVVRMLEQQREELRKELLDAYEVMAKRAPIAPAAPAPPPWWRRPWIAVGLYLGLLLIPIVWSAALFLQARPTPPAPAPATAPSAVAAPAPAGKELAQQTTVLLETIAWAASLSGRYDYDRVPLDDERLAMLRELILRLSIAEFAGTVRIDTHAGEFCVTRAASGVLRPPPDDTPADKCDLPGLTPEQYIAMGRRQSPSFASFVANSALVNAGNIKLQIISHGRDRPLYEYPILANVQTAGEWNRIARLNNRVEITLIPLSQPPLAQK